MKIGIFTDTYYPQINGVATSVLMLNENLEQQGHSIYIFTTTDPKAPANEHNVYRLPSIPFASTRRIGAIYHPSIARKIRALQLDLIHTHTEFSLGIGNQVIFAGEKPWDQIGLYYQLGDLFVSASQSETQGLTYIEALAAGLPLIAKTDSCLDHVLFGGVNGYEFSDKAGFLNVLETALSSETNLQNMSIAALRSTVTFSAMTFAGTVAALYEETLSQKNNDTRYKEETRCLQLICDPQQTA